MQTLSGMVALKSRQHQIPGGFKFQQPETRWTAPSFASFDTIVSGLMAHRQANPYLVQKFGWAIDRATVEYEVEQYNAQICRAMGWKNFIVTDENIAAPPPKSFPLPRRAVAGDEQQGPSPSLLKRVSHAGEKVRGLIEGYNAIQAWRDSGKSPVGFPLAEKRASTCAACPLNEPGD